MGEIQSEEGSIWPSPTVWGVVAFLALALFGLLLFIASAWAAGFSALLFFLMAMILLTDLRAFIVPDVLSLPAIPLGILANAMLAPAETVAAVVTESLAGAVIGAGVLYLLRAVYFRLRNIEGLGLGDVKLAAVAGAWLGPGALAPACLLAALAAFICLGVMAVLKGRNLLHARMPVPFGSFMAAAIVLVWIGQILGLMH